MYNHGMPTYQIRRCNSCGLRYPLTEGNTFGTRCPICMGETRLMLSRELLYEPMHSRPSSDSVSLPKQNGELAVLIDNIRSAWNVGSIFRSADGFGFAHAYLCGITPTPEVEAVTKTSLNAEDSVTWSYHKDAVKLVKGLKKEGWQIWVLEESKKGKSVTQAPKLKANERAVLIAGSEVTGVDPELLDLADNIFYIPMQGEKKSFNVAMAFSIAAYALRH